MHLDTRLRYELCSSFSAGTVDREEQVRARTKAACLVEAQRAGLPPAYHTQHVTLARARVTYRLTISKRKKGMLIV